MQQNVFQLTGVDQIIPVNGIEGAKSYPMGPNCRAALFDSNEDVFYIKKTDANGFPEVKRYRFEEEVIVDSTNSGTAVSLQDIRSIIREEIGSIKEEILNVQQPVSITNAESEARSNNADNSTTTNDGKYHSNKQRYKQSRSNSSVVVDGEEQQ